MGKLVLTRRAGESVKLTEPNGREWLLTLLPMKHVGTRWTHFELNGVKKVLGQSDSLSFGGGTVELRPYKRSDQAILAFDFPRDVTIVRTEIA